MVRPINLKHDEFQGLRAQIASFIESKLFISFITIVIIINAVTLGMETDSEAVSQYGELLHHLDRIALGVFVIEIALKLFTYRLSFFRQGWNVFDFVIVGISLVPAVGPLSILRTLRILRVLRLVSVMPQMRRVISALLTAIPGMASIIAVLSIIFYVCAVLATKLFGADFDALFGTISASMFTLFQIMTLEGWANEVVRPVMEVHPSAWLFFIPFIIITSFAVLNLFIGIIVDAMNMIHDDPGETRETTAREDIDNIRKDIDEIKRLLKTQKKPKK